MDGSALFPIRLSLQVASVATLLIVLIGISLAYFLAMRVFRGREFLDMLLTLPLVLPPTGKRKRWSGLSRLHPVNKPWIAILWTKSDEKRQLIV